MDTQYELDKQKIYALKDRYLHCYQENERLHSLINKILAHVREKTPAFYDADEFLKNGFISQSQYQEAKTIREFETELANIRQSENDRLTNL